MKLQKLSGKTKHNIASIINSIKVNETMRDDPKHDFNFFHKLWAKDVVSLYDCYGIELPTLDLARDALK